MTTTIRFAAVALAILISAEAEAQMPTEIAGTAGTWDVEVKLWLQGPDAPPETTTGMEEVILGPGGFWLTRKYKIEPVMGGPPVHSQSTFGYDTAKKKFVEARFEAGEVQLLEGEYDQATRTVTGYGKYQPVDEKPWDLKVQDRLRSDSERSVVTFIKNDRTGGAFIKLSEWTSRRRAP